MMPKLVLNKVQGEPEPKGRQNETFMTSVSNKLQMVYGQARRVTRAVENLKYNNFSK
jgi:hypothetical protein